MKLYLAPFSYGGMNPHTVESLIAEVRLLDQKKVPITLKQVHDDALISRSRSRAMTEFLKSDCDVMFMVDHDIEWNAGDLLATADMAHLKKSIVGGMYSMRGKNQGCASRLKGEKVTVHIGRDTLHEADSVAGGFVAIPRVVVDEVLKAGTAAAAALQHADANMGMETANRVIAECLDYVPFYDFFRCVTVASVLSPNEHEMASEDWSFCLRARWANPERKQYLWSKPVLVHHGTYGFVMAEAAQLVDPLSQVRR